MLNKGERESRQRGGLLGSPRRPDIFRTTKFFGLCGPDAKHSERIVRHVERFGNMTRENDERTSISTKHKKSLAAASSSEKTGPHKLFFLFLERLDIKPNDLYRHVKS
jgi:hypothetical protein